MNLRCVLLAMYRGRLGYILTETNVHHLATIILPSPHCHCNPEFLVTVLRHMKDKSVNMCVLLRADHDVAKQTPSIAATKSSHLTVTTDKCRSCTGRQTKSRPRLANVRLYCGEGGRYTTPRGPRKRCTRFEIAPSPW